MIRLIKITFCNLYKNVTRYNVVRKEFHTYLLINVSLYCFAFGVILHIVLQSVSDNALSL